MKSGKDADYELFHALKAQHVAGDYEKCFAGLDKLARAGHPEAQLLLAKIHEAGIPGSVPRNLALAHKWAVSAEFGGFKAAAAYRKALLRPAADAPAPPREPRSATVVPVPADPRPDWELVGERSATAPDNGPMLITELGQALAGEELALYLQPVIDVEQSRLAGFEGLLRWEHPARGRLLPQDFLDGAESAGLMGQIDLRVLRLAIDSAKLLDRADHKSDCYISVNLSRTSLLDPGLPRTVQELLRQGGVAPQRLSLNLRSSLSQLAGLKPRLSELLALGVRISIDDVITNYAAQSLLANVPASLLKINRNTVRQAMQDPQQERIVRSIALLARTFNLEVVAEGCSSPAEVTRMARLGCRYQQGHFYAPAVPIGQALEMLADRAWIKANLEGLVQGRP